MPISNTTDIGVMIYLTLTGEFSPYIQIRRPRPMGCQEDSMGKYSNPSGLSCSFCHKRNAKLRKIIAGPNVFICSECIRLCLDIIENAAETRCVGSQRCSRTSEDKSFLDQYVVGQDQAKRKLSVGVYNHYKRLEANSQANESDGNQKVNVLLIGSTGTGKTLLAQTARFDVPFVMLMRRHSPRLDTLVRMSKTSSYNCIKQQI